MKTTLDIIILTRDEEVNLPYALKSVAPLGAKVWVVDSGSTDNTEKITREHGAEFIRHLEYKNQAQQFNWALDNLSLTGEWVLRLDADEWLTPELVEEIKTVISSPSSVNGYYLKRRVYFMERWIRHGGYYPTWLLRFFRRGRGRSEEREMDEHIVVLEGRVEHLKHDFVDENRKGLAAWTAKHNDFSTREAAARLRELTANNQKLTAGLKDQVERKRWMKTSVYARFPLFCRAFLYFCYRYFIRLGFLDGVPGLIFHFLQGCWHQFLIDAKMYEKAHRQRHAS